MLKYLRNIHLGLLIQSAVHQSTLTTRKSIINSLGSHKSFFSIHFKKQHLINLESFCTKDHFKYILLFQRQLQMKLQQEFWQNQSNMQQNVLMHFGVMYIRPNVNIFKRLYTMQLNMSKCNVVVQLESFLVVQSQYGHSQFEKK